MHYEHAAATRFRSSNGARMHVQTDTINQPPEWGRWERSRDRAKGDSFAQSICMCKLAGHHDYSNPALSQPLNEAPGPLRIRTHIRVDDITGRRQNYGFVHDQIPSARGCRGVFVGRSSPNDVVGVFGFNRFSGHNHKYHRKTRNDRRRSLDQRKQPNSVEGYAMDPYHLEPLPLEELQ
jgi:hypothetical protein